MPRRKVRKPSEKQPQQARSRVTVEAILEATIRIFESEGPDAATTSRIAEVAGVSVGTLYQYFSNRDAIIDALQDREFERSTKLLGGLLGTRGNVADQDVARAVVEKLLESYRAAPALHRVLAVEGLRVTPTERVQAFDMRAIATIRAFLSLGGGAVRRRNVDAAAFVVYQAVRATMLAYLLEQPAGLDDQALVEELTDLVVRYLVGPRVLSLPRPERARTRA